MAIIKDFKITILSITDMTSYPGWVLCSFQDVDGITHFIEEKIPVVTADDLNENSLLPCDTTIKCEVLKQEDNITTINLAVPWGIETRDEKTVFWVASDQLSDSSIE